VLLAREKRVVREELCVCACACVRVRGRAWRGGASWKRRGGHSAAGRRKMVRNLSYRSCCMCLVGMEQCNVDKGKNVGSGTQQRNEQGS
jgi:hypothetical protein